MLVEPQYCVNLHYISFKKKLNFLPHLRSTKRVVLAPTVLNALLFFGQIGVISIFLSIGLGADQGEYLQVGFLHHTPSYLIHVPEITYI